ncbi:MAG: type IV pilus assembly protein PilM [Bdellovibrionaceae bacterium]|nr:type IV pilus assembly protein PilM [Pseudobdellovibrionaceae bacterium]
MFFKSKKVIGLDIGSSSIKLAELDVSKSGATLQSFRLAPTPLNAISSGELTDPVALGATIRGLFDELGSKRKNISTGMWGMAVIVKKITMPKMDAKLLAEQIRYEAEQYIPFDINNVSLAHHVLTTSASPDTQDVLLVAAQNELVSQYMRTVELAGLTCKVLDVNGFALANCFEMNYGRFPGQNIGLLSFGASITNFVVISNGDVVFSRDISVGGANHTSEISKGMGVSLQEAEMLKLSAVAGQEVPDDVTNLITMTNETVAEEVRNSLDFLGATTNGMTLHRCLITGGASPTPGLADSISRTTSLRLETLNPLMKVKVNAKKIPPEYLDQIMPFSAIAIGLGLRQAGDA